MVMCVQNTPVVEDVEDVETTLKQHGIDYSMFRTCEVRIGHSLNEAEVQYLKKRTNTILECLKQHKISCSEDMVPKIAVLGSGGGLRAMIGLLGSLNQLNKEGLLDSVMYLGGVSGCTWCMASLYKETDWATKLENMTEGIVERLANGSVNWSEMANKLLNCCKLKDTFSLTDVWAALFVFNVVKEIDDHHLTEQRGKHTNDPYPIYTVIDKQSKYDRQNADVWFEITPDECGYSVTGAFVDSSCFESQFENGKISKRQPENDMLYLQGLCGSAIADEEEILKTLWHLITDRQKGRQVLLELVKLNLCVLRGEDPSAHCKTLNDLIKGQIREDVTLTQEVLKEDTLHICGSFFDWFGDDWGVKEVHPDILSSEIREYEDAGNLLNSPYFSVLRKEQDIDLIISLDFSAGDPFATVVQTAKMCKELQIPFPEVVVPGENTEPKDFYVFRGYTKAPTVIHVPLFNCVNCKGEIQKWEKKYSTFNQSYSRSDIEALLDKVALNIKNNKENLLTEIKKIC